MLQLQRVGHSLVTEQQQLASRVKAARYLLRSMEAFPGIGYFPVAVQLLSRVRLFATPWTAACYLLEFTHIH